jgi:hypothetical protein
MWPLSAFRSNRLRPSVHFDVGKGSEKPMGIEKSATEWPLPRRYSLTITRFQPQPLLGCILMLLLAKSIHSQVWPTWTSTRTSNGNRTHGPNSDVPSSSTNLHYIDVICTISRLHIFFTLRGHNPSGPSRSRSRSFTLQVLFFSLLFYAGPAQVPFSHDLP